MTIKKTFTLLFAALLSLAAGVLGGLLAFSYCVGLLPLGRAGENLPPARVVERYETVIQENKALKNAIAKAAGAVILIKVGSGKTAVYGSGVILSSDGLAATNYSLFPPGAAAEVAVGGKKTTFEVLKRDKAANLVILKLQDSDWSTAGFYDLANLKLGERVFLAGFLADGRGFVNEGIARDFTAETINTTINESSAALGAPVFDIEGNIIGIADVAKSGQVSVIPISKIKEASGL